MDCPACHAPQPDLPGARFCAICGTLLPRYGEMDPLVGRLIGGRFLIKNLIAIGGMGRVYGADQQMGSTLRRLAVKVLLADYTINPDVVSRFMRECSTVSELEHPNTIKFYDFGQTDDGHLYIAMEYVPGPSLAHVMKNEGALPPDRVDRIVSQICGSLQEAHDKGFVHRDLKPENILLSTHSGEEDFVKVLDFGIAKRAGANVPKITQEGMVLGSPPYMSPEQFSRADLDARSDIYSLAVVAYKALTAQKPFNADKPVEWATEHMTAMPLPFDATPVGAAVPLNMKRAVMRALSKKPSDRPQTMREFYGEFTLGNTRSSLLGRSAPPPAEMYTPMPPRPAPAASETTVDRPLRPAGGTVVLDPPRNAASMGAPHTPGTTTDIGPAIAARPPPPAGPSPTRVDGAQPHMAATGQATAMRVGSDRPPHGMQAPPFGAQPTRVDMVPETMREPVPMTVRDRKRNGVLVASSIAGAVLLIGALVLVGWLVVRGAGRTPTAPTSGLPRTSPTVAPVTTTPPALTGSPTAAPQATLAPTAAPKTPPAIAPVSNDACHLCIHHALADRCDEALRFRKLCADSHPNHRDAHVTFDLHCKQ